MEQYLADCIFHKSPLR